MKIIEKLWEGQVLPIEVFGKENDEVRNSEAKLFAYIEKLKDIIGEDAVEALQRIANDCLNESSKQAFVDGFALGVGLTSEAIQKAEKLIIK